MATVTGDCGNCHRTVQMEIPSPSSSDTTLTCPHCQSRWGEVNRSDTIFQSCPHCQCRQFYAQKDFNRGLGCGIVCVGILLVPATYGLSLPIFAAFDWLLYRKVRTMVICYRCGTEFRGFPVPAYLKSFRHHIGLKYDKGKGFLRK